MHFDDTETDFSHLFHQSLSLSLQNHSVAAFWMMNWMDMVVVVQMASRCPSHLVSMHVLASISLLLVVDRDHCSVQNVANFCFWDENRSVRLGGLPASYLVHLWKPWLLNGCFAVVVDDTLEGLQQQLSSVVAKRSILSKSYHSQRVSGHLCFVDIPVGTEIHLVRLLLERRMILASSHSSIDRRVFGFGTIVESFSRCRLMVTMNLDECSDFSLSLSSWMHESIVIRQLSPKTDLPRTKNLPIMM
jgi:hypothetical protein